MPQCTARTLTRGVYNGRMNTTDQQLDEVTRQLKATFGKFENEFNRQIDPALSHNNKLGGWARTGPIELRTSPGSGKTKHAIDFVNRLADKGLYAAYFVLSHTIAKDMKQKSEGEMAHWGHWKAHRKVCNKAASTYHLQEKGYQVSFSCDCKWREQFRTDRPSIMPMDYEPLRISWRLGKLSPCQRRDG